MSETERVLREELHQLKETCAAVDQVLAELSPEDQQKFYAAVNAILARKGAW